ncbi:Cytochrome c oxidase subunit 6 [Peltigera leucophlebia]|nr:Cytochrome c oxidase subunit 6 [Peltigera leucophlebia]
MSSNYRCVLSAPGPSRGVTAHSPTKRNLNNAFAYDLVPSPSVVAAALKAARRVNDYPTAVRVFEAVKAKVENKGQYDEYVRDLAPLREELGVNLKEELYPEPWQ